MALDIAAELEEIRESAAPSVPAAIENLGPDGAYVRTEAAEHLAQGASVRIKFALDSHPIPFLVEAQVRWVKGGRAGGVGLQFVNLPNYDRSVLDDYCQRIIDQIRGANTGE